MSYSNSISRRAFLAGAAGAGTLIAMHPFSAMANSAQAHLRLMETTDIHVAIHPYDYYADRPNDTMGLARTARIIENIRAEATNTMLVDNGDLIQGNPMGRLCGLRTRIQRRRPTPHDRRHEHAWL